METHEFFPPPAPDFSDPLGLLRACHERILRHSDLLVRLAEHIATSGADDEARKTAAAIYRYFTTAGKHHHQDEEQDLFPRLARQSLKLADRVHRLKQEHPALDAIWQELEPLLADLTRVDDMALFAELAARFADAQRRHVTAENKELFDVAQHIFSDRELQDIGKAMAVRRGLRTPLSLGWLPATQ